MDINALLIAGIGLASLVAAVQSWRDREHRHDVLLLAATGVGLGTSAVLIAV
jgi:hypothetical protein